MGQIVGPFDVQDAQANELAAVQAVAARIPPAMTAADGPGRQRVWFRRRFGAPTYAWGYTPNGRDMWVNPAFLDKTASLQAQLEYVTAHEYWHGWQARHGRQAGPLLALATIGTPGTHQSGSFTNRRTEALADALARALGFTDGVPRSYYRVQVPTTSYGRLLDALGKVEARPLRASHTYRLSGRVALRQSPQRDAPAVAWAVAGSEIRAVDGRSGGPYVIRLADGAGLRSLLWLAVDVLDGRLLESPLWTAALLWVPIPALPEPAPPAPPSSPA